MDSGVWATESKTKTGVFIIRALDFARVGCRRTAFRYLLVAC